MTTSKHAFCNAWGAITSQPVSLTAWLQDRHYNVYPIPLSQISSLGGTPIGADPSWTLASSELQLLSARAGRTRLSPCHQSHVLESGHIVRVGRGMYTLGLRRCIFLPACVSFFMFYVPTEMNSHMLLII